MMKNMSKIEIAVSYSRKVNHALYGGKNYENSDFFCSAKQEFEVGTKTKILTDKTKQMQGWCKEQVDRAVMEETNALQGISEPVREGLNKREYTQVRLKYMESQTPPTQEQWEKMNTSQRRWYRDTENTIKSLTTEE